MQKIFQISDGRVAIVVTALATASAAWATGGGPLALAIALLCAIGWGIIRFQVSRTPETTEEAILTDENGEEIDNNDMFPRLMAIHAENQQPLWRYLLPFVIPEVVTVVAIILITLGLYQAAIRLPEPMGPVAQQYAAWPSQRAEMVEKLRAAYNEERYLDTLRIVNEAYTMGYIDEAGKLGWVMALTYGPKYQPLAKLEGYCKAESNGSFIVSVSTTAGVVETGKTLFNCGQLAPVELPAGSTASVIATGFDHLTLWHSVNVRVIDADNAPVHGLGKANFRIIGTIGTKENSLREFLFAEIGKTLSGSFAEDTYQLSWYGDADTVELVSTTGTMVEINLDQWFATTYR